MPSQQPKLRSRKRASGTTGRFTAAPIRAAVCMARPRSLATRTSKDSPARRRAMASAWARPFSVSALSPCPWMRASMFHCVSPWRTTTMRVILSPRCRTGPNRIGSIHVRHERVRHADRAVGVLEILEDRDHGASHGEPGTVDGVHRGDLSLLVAKARLHAARLERLEVRARGDFAIGTLPRQPHLEVVSLRAREARVA